MGNDAIAVKREIADWVTLVITFALGVSGSIALKLTGLHPSFAALWASGALFAYVFFVWSHCGRTWIEPEITGDNCYYLGFVFTLTSLAVTLYQMTGSEGGQSAVRDVISGFGIALSSTIVGIMLRVCLMRLRNDIDESEARKALHLAMRQFRDELHSSTMYLKNYSIESTQLMAEEHREIMAITQKTTSDATAVYSEELKKFRHAYEELLENHSKATKESTEHQMKTFETTITEAGKESAVAISDTMEQLLERSFDSFTQSVEALHTKISGFLSEDNPYATLSEAARHLESLAMRLDKAGEKLGAATNRIIDSQELEQATRALENKITAFTSIFDSTTKTASVGCEKTLDRIEESTLSSTKRIEKSFERLDTAFEQVSAPENLISVLNSFKESANILEKIVRGLEEISESVKPLAAETPLARIKNVWQKRRKGNGYEKK